MKYHLNWLIEKYNKKEDLEYIFFWGHRKSKDSSITKTCFSQWWISSFVVDGLTYASAEHWMMAEKARLFGDEEMRQKILKNPSPAEAKKSGRKVKNFDSAIWNKECYEIVKQGNIHKFSQNEKLKAFLLSTTNKIIVEASPYDGIWGIGLLQNDERVLHPPQWCGRNLLGFVLMEVRDELK